MGPLKAAGCLGIVPDVVSHMKIALLSLLGLILGALGGAALGIAAGVGRNLQHHEFRRL